MTPCQSRLPSHSSRVVEDVKLAFGISEMKSTPLHLRIPQSSPKANASLTPPPLDHATIYSDDDDSATSSSSISDNYPETKSTQPTGATRSIFKQYWAKDKAGDDLSSRSYGEIPPLAIVIVQSSSANEHDRLGYHKITSKQEAQRQEQEQQRRCIFQMNGVSQPLPAAETAVFPRNECTLALNKPCTKEHHVTTRSCLLKCRHSGAKTPRDSSCSSLLSLTSSLGDGDDSERSNRSERSVNFSADVQVLVYQKPLERYATKGWSNYFAF
jgi:hypothetical protein